MSTVYPAWILERSFGGIRTADSPVSAKADKKWPDGPSPPMASEACNALVSACNEPPAPGDPSCMVILVGGAGNGKSKLAADTVTSVNGSLLGKPRAFAQRTYSYGLAAGGRLRVLNDATIPPDDRHDKPLVRDLAEAINAGDHLLACINRGVLISETRNGVSTGADDASKLASMVARWLLSGTIEPHSACEVSLVPVGDDGQHGHYAVAEARTGDTARMIIHVVYMDRASLLEHWSEATPASVNYQTPLPVVPIEVMPVLYRGDSPRAAVFEGCAREAARAYVGEGEFDPLDPIGANVASMSKDAVARGWCSLLRGAEVISGTQFTYRELWALFSHSMVGPVTSEGLGSLSSWTRDRLVEARTETGEKRLDALLGLGTLRTHMLLFDAGNAGGNRSEYLKQYPWPSTSNEALGSARLADPLRQFGPVDGFEHTGLAERLAEIEEGRLPGARLAAEDAAVAACWTVLDAEIEHAIRNEVTPREEEEPQNEETSLRKRNRLLGWYGRYMFRLVGLARGWSAHCSVVNEWQLAWLDAAKRQKLSYELENAILEIVAPSSGGESETYFTFLQPRVDAGDGTVESALVGVRRNRFDVEAGTKAGRVELRISQPSWGKGPAAAVTSLDFHLLREAMARRNGHGFTDSLMLIEPRIERIRASLVTRQLSQPGDENRFKFRTGPDSIVTR